MSSANNHRAPARRNFVLTVGIVLAGFLIFSGVLVVAYLPTWKAALPQTSFTEAEVVEMVKAKKIDEGEAWRYSVAGRENRLVVLRGREQTVATTYGWVDQSGGVVRLPIERAMELVVAEHTAKN